VAFTSLSVLDRIASLRCGSIDDVRRYWNHNTYYHRTLLRLLPANLDRVLDVGCGDGVFAARLADTARDVLAIDTEPAQVAEADRRTSGCDRVSVRRADFMSEPLQPDTVTWTKPRGASA